MTTTTNELNHALVTLVSAAFAGAQADQNKNKGFYTKLLEVAQRSEDKAEFLATVKAVETDWKADKDGLASDNGGIKGDKGNYLIPSSIMTAKSQLKSALELGIELDGKKYQEVVREVREAKAAKKAAEPTDTPKDKDTGGNDDTDTALTGTLADIQQAMNAIMANAKQADDATQAETLKALLTIGGALAKRVQAAA